MVRLASLLCAATLLFLGCGGDTSKEPPAAPPAQVAPAKPTTPPPPPPVAQEDEGYEELDVIAEADPDEGPPPLRVQFTATVEDENGGPYKFEWDFGDGTKSTEQNPLHTYQKLGEYTATLNAADDKGNNGSDEVDIFVEEEEG
jgi:PKD repeat protein